MVDRRDWWHLDSTEAGGEEGEEANMQEVRVLEDRRSPQPCMHA